MDEFRQWAICLIIAAVACTLVTVISPRGSVDKTVKAVAGVFVVAVICAPLADLPDFEFAFTDEKTTQSYDYEAEEKIVELYGEAVSQRVAELADEKGVQVISVETDVSLDENGCIIIHKIAVEVADCDSEEELEKSLSESLGATVDVRNGMTM